jgi:hypothetical protein
MTCYGELLVLMLMKLRIPAEQSPMTWRDSSRSMLPVWQLKVPVGESTFSSIFFQPDMSQCKNDD